MDPRGIAAVNGLKEGDVIVKLNKTVIKSVDQFSDIMNDIDSGDMMLFYVQRGNANLYLAFPMPL